MKSIRTAVAVALEGPLSDIYRSMLRTVDTVFPNVYVFSVDHLAAGPQRTTNVILLASNDNERLTEAEWLARAERYQSASHVTAAEMTKMVADLLAEQAPDPAAPIFTDDYAPIETMRF